MRRKHFSKKPSSEPVHFSWTLFLIASLQVSVWSFGVWEHPFHQFLVDFQHNVRGERPNQHLSYDKPLPSLTQQLLELLSLRAALQSVTLRSAESAYLSKNPPKLIKAPNPAQSLGFKASLYSEEESEKEAAASIVAY
mmetsp:Transcript_18161/g.30092  ORF Transcript_18161/g.30092 Transcript_18161/m.30092 type:complete len:138 (-) Transcript_18161:1342-1755(-)